MPASGLLRTIRAEDGMLDADPQVLQRITDAGMDIALLPVRFAQAGMGRLEDLSTQEVGATGAAFAGPADRGHDEAIALQRAQKRLPGGRTDRFRPLC